MTFKYLSVTKTVLLDLVDLPWWSPLDKAGVHQQSWFFVLCTLQMLLNQLGSYADNVLTFPIFDQVEGLQGGDDVCLCNAGDGAQFPNAESPSEVPQYLEEDPAPVTSVTQFPHVTQGLLRAANHPLHLAQLVGEGNQELAVAFPLVGRQGKNAGNIVPVWGLLFFGEISHYVGPVFVDLTQDVEDEGLHIEIQSLVIQEQFGQQAEVLTVELAFLPVNLEYAGRSLPVDLFTACWLVDLTVGHVAPVGLLVLHVLQTILTDPQLGTLPVLLGVRREIPGVD